MEMHAFFFMQGADDIAQLRPQNFFHRPGFGRYHMDFQPAGDERSRHFQSDETGAHHQDPFGILGTSDNRPAIGETAQGKRLARRRAGKLHAHRLGAGRDQQPVIGKRAAIRTSTTCRSLGNDGADPCPQAQIDTVIGVIGVRPERHPFLGRAASQVVFGQIGAIHRGGGVIAEHDDVALVSRDGEAFPPRRSRPRRHRR